MTRQTSIEAYHYVKDSGYISMRHREVYLALYKFGPLTGNETIKKMMEQQSYVKKTKLTTVTSARFTELRDMGAIYEVGKRRCSLSNRTCILWDVTKDLPVKPEKKLSNAVKIMRLKKAYKLLIRYAATDIKVQARAILEGKNEVDL